MHCLNLAIWYRADKLPAKKRSSFEDALEYQALGISGKLMTSETRHGLLWWT
jgi:hypothetical protein